MKDVNRIRALNRELKFFDQKLYAVKTEQGLVQIYRKGIRWESFDTGFGVLFYSRSDPHYILSLTDDWSLHGEPVDWGIEPLLARLREIDEHNQDVLGRIHEENRKKEELRKRAYSNERKAMAYDLRRDFARAVNDVNTSTLEKVDLRRKKDAYCS